MLNRIVHLSRGNYHALNRVEVSSSALLHNYHYLVQKSGKTTFPVLKSNAYGHGITTVAKALDHLRVPYFCVDSIYEAYQLLNAKIKTPILIMGYVHPESLQVKKLPFSYVVFGSEMIDAISKYQPHAKIHIFVDTGMHREGVPLGELAELIERAKALNLNIEGVMSHLAMADKPNHDDTKNQVRNFLQTQEICKSKGVNPVWTHLGASSCILNYEDYPDYIGNAARTGIQLYGIDPENKNVDLKPALQLISTVVQIKDLKKDDKVGYDFTFTAQNDQKIAVLPIGYNDGINRRLSNKGHVLINTTFCPILGRVSMNLCVVDVSKVSNVKVGDEVVVYSQNPKHRNSISNSALLCETIAYELLVYLHTSTKRILI